MRRSGGRGLRAAGSGARARRPAVARHPSSSSHRGVLPSPSQNPVKPTVLLHRQPTWRIVTDHPLSASPAVGVDQPPSTHSLPTLCAWLCCGFIWSAPRRARDNGGWGGGSISPPHAVAAPPFCKPPPHVA